MADSIIHSPSQRSEDHAILRDRRGMVWFVTQEKAQAFLSLDEVAVLFRSGCTLHQYASIALTWTRCNPAIPAPIAIVASRMEISNRQFNRTFHHFDPT